MFERAVLPLANLSLIGVAACGVFAQIAIVAAASNYALAMVYA